MKKNYYKIISAICVIGGFTSCADFLEIKPQNEIILEDFWNEKADVDNIVAGCYSALQGDGVRRRMMVWGEVRSDNVQAGQNVKNDDISLYDVLRENINAKNNYTNWDGFYDVINRCNTVIKYAPGVAAIDPAYTEGDLKATIAEVSALRDLCYFYLIRTFRNVPYSTVAFTDDDQKMDLPATPFETVLDSLISDLERVKGDAVSRYPDNKPRYQTGRITRNAIYAMLCEMYLWKKDYDNCIKYAELVTKALADIEEENRTKSSRFSSSEATLEARLSGFPLENDALSGNYFGDAYEAIFVTGASKETIFELNYDKNPTSSGMIANSAVQAFFGSSSTSGLLQASTLITEDIAKTSSRTIYEDVNKKIDSRMYVNCDPEKGEVNKLACRSITVDATSANSVKATTSMYAKDNNSSQWIIYRLPDIMLLEAEALCQKMQEGSDSAAIEANKPLLEKAFRLVNAINKRSIAKAILTDADTLKPVNYNTRNLMEGLVMRERQRELMFEGKRYFDLVRYSLRDGNTSTIISAVANRDDVNGQFVQNFFKKMDAIFWPYNYEEMKVNTNLEPNPAFGSGESTSMEKAK